MQLLFYKSGKKMIILKWYLLILNTIVNFLMLKSDSHSCRNIFFICFNEGPLKMMKNAFHFKSSFRPQDISIFVVNFWLYRKNGFMRKIRLISQSMMSQPGLQTIAIHLLPNISRSKGNQAMKFGQVIKYNRNIFLQKWCRKWGKETSSKALFIF